MRLGAVSIDLDELVHYARIHGLPEDVAPVPRVYQVACERFGELMDRHGLSGTAFVIGESLVRGPRHEAAADAVRALAAAGHEIGNHTFSHDYRLTRRVPCESSEQVRKGAEAIEQVVGRRPVGFRAPGYNVDGDLLSVVAALGHRYDSSVFPSWPYFAARAAVIGALSVLRRPSASLVGDPRVLRAPSVPYRPDLVAWWRDGPGPLVELPVAAVPALGLPFIGTTITTLPTKVTAAAFELLRRRDFLGLELHGIDLMDGTDGIHPALVRRQPDLRVPVREKLRRLHAVLGRLKDAYDVRTLAEVAIAAGV